MKILGLDFETTGLEANQERVIEIGAVIWCTESQKPLSMMSELIKFEGFTQLPPEITKITGIDDDMINSYGVGGESSFEKLNQMIKGCEYVVAHNAKFDRSFYEAEMKRYNLDFDFSALKWIDTCNDVPYSEDIQTRKLSYLAAEHGILNTNAHRALFDVIVMLNVLKHYSINDVVERSNSPLVQVIAKVSFAEKDKAKNMGFRWNKDDKTWFKEFKEMDLASRQFPFEIEKIHLH